MKFLNSQNLMHMYKDVFGREFESYEDYCNSDYLDSDLIQSYLWSGKRTPQKMKKKENYWMRCWKLNVEGLKHSFKLIRLSKD